jgi:hypothetical protein
VSVQAPLILSLLSDPFWSFRDSGGCKQHTLSVRAVRYFDSQTVKTGQKKEKGTRSWWAIRLADSPVKWAASALTWMLITIVSASPRLGRHRSKMPTARPHSISVSLDHILLFSLWLIFFLSFRDVVLIFYKKIKSNPSNNNLTSANNFVLACLIL